MNAVTKPRQASTQIVIIPDPREKFIPIVFALWPSVARFVPQAIRIHSINNKEDFAGHLRK